MSKFLDLVESTYPFLAEQEDENPSPDIIPTSDEENTALPKEIDSTVKVQLVKLAVETLFIDKNRLEESNPSARTIINQISDKTPIDITNVEETQKLLEELIALVEIPS
jgi:hypothetical protein